MDVQYQSTPVPGQVVVVRQCHFVVVNVKKSDQSPGLVRASGERPQHLVTLSSIEDEALGEELQVVWEIEPGAVVREKVALPDPSGFDDPVRLDAFLDAVRWGAASVADIRFIQAPFRSGIEIEKYQLDPLVRAVRMPRVNLLIADDVGLGKTIETGLIIQEFMLRHRIRSVLVVCPSSLQIHWRDQMRDRFGLEFRIVDRELMGQLRRRRGLRVNPWTHFPRLITSIDFLKRERPLRLFKEVLPAEGEAIYPRKFDLLVIDESHNIAPSGRGQYAIDSMRTAAIRQLVPHFEHRLFLSATPHNGYTESFTALLELLDNQRFARGIAPDQKQLQTIMVRRLKSEIVDWDGSPKFPKRELIPLEVDYTEEEKNVHAALRRYTSSRLRNITDQAENFAIQFVLKLLKKRLFSSPAAFKSTLEQHIQSLDRATRRAKGSERRPTIGILRQQVDRIEDDTDNDEQYEDLTNDAVEVTTRLFREPTGDERGILTEMMEWAKQAVGRPDSKTEVLIQWLKQTVKPNDKWSKERVIVFTEYRATQKWLLDMFALHGLGEGSRLMTLYGGMDSDSREAIKAAFQANPDESPVRILLATDAASEGIDLQNHCHRLVHFEIPWNPNRMEQRNGRVDRYRQRAKEVLIHHFVGKGYRQDNLFRRDDVNDLEADLEFLMRAVIKVENIRTDLGKVGPVIAEQVEEAMLGQRQRQLDTDQAERTAKRAGALLKFERDIQRQLEQFTEQLNETKSELRLSPENIQNVVEIALELVGQPPLQEAEVPGIWPDPRGRRARCPVFRLPALRGSWAACSEGLAHPHSGKIRPIVFDHSLVDSRDDVVLCHLNHRLVQMSLRLLRAEVWSTQDRKLNRVTARLVPNNVLQTPALIGHARLVVIGGDSQRLHEEIITAGGVIREGRFARMNVGETRKALEAGLPDEAPESITQRLLELWPKHSESLKAALEVRMKDRTNGLQKFLRERADKETAAMAAILNELKKSIEQKLEAETEDLQLALPTMEEQEQYKWDMENLRTRLNQIPEEIEQEKKVIQSRFANPQPRLFPVAVTFLVPEKLARGAM